MSGTCKECGAATEWEAELGSAVCVHCGTLADPTQSVLSSHLENTDTSAREFPFYDAARGNTLKGRNGWALVGQGKEARDRKNTIAMHDFIRSVAIRLSNPGLVPRAHGIFDQAMARAQYRWGRRAKLAAGAAIVIALRESRKNDSIRDIAYFLDVTPVSLNRMFSAVVSLLQLPLTLADPASHIASLQTYLVALVQAPSASGPSLPAALMTALTALLPRMREVGHTASALADLVSRTNALAHLPTPPTACALLLLALEAERRDSLPHAGVLAEALGGRVGKGKGVVMQRYKVVYELVEEWIEEIPWLEGHSKTRPGGRSKVAKRVVVARGLKDVLQFREEIWRRKMEALERPLLELELDSQDSISEDEKTETGSSGRGDSEYGEGSGPPRKKRKTVHERTIADASQFLLDPTVSVSGSSRRKKAKAAGTDLLTHLLTADDASLPHVFTKAPTRLQLLATERGGAEEGDVLDEELFADGELEGMIRTEDEVETLRNVMKWDDNEDAGEPDAEQDPVAKKGKKRASQRDVDQGVNREQGTKRIDFAALAKIMDPSADISGDVEDEDVTPFAFTFGDEGEVVEAWRPLSPGGQRFDDDWYDD